MLPIIVQDKANHFIYGSIISVIAYAVFILVVKLPNITIWGTVSVVLVIACLKEAFDYIDNRRLIKAGQPPIHGVEVADVLFTVAGALPVIAMHWLLIAHA